MLFVELWSDYSLQSEFEQIFMAAMKNGEKSDKIVRNLKKFKYANDSNWILTVFHSLSESRVRQSR